MRTDTDDAERLVDGGAGVVGWLFEHGHTTFWVIFALAMLVVLVRLAYTVALAWADLRLKHRLGDTAGATTDWLGHRGPDGRSGLYTAYMVSPQWRERSRRTIMLAGGLCEDCGQAKAREAHHVTYDRLGFERDGDLRALCGPCHRRAHGRG